MEAKKLWEIGPDPKLKGAQTLSWEKSLNGHPGYVSSFAMNIERGGFEYSVLNPQLCIVKHDRAQLQPTGSLKVEYDLDSSLSGVALRLTEIQTRHLTTNAKGEQTVASQYTFSGLTIKNPLEESRWGDESSVQLIYGDHGFSEMVLSTPSNKWELSLELDEDPTDFLAHIRVNGKMRDGQIQVNPGQPYIFDGVIVIPDVTTFNGMMGYTVQLGKGKEPLDHIEIPRRYPHTQSIQAALRSNNPELWQNALKFVTTSPFPTTENPFAA